MHFLARALLIKINSHVLLSFWLLDSSKRRGLPRVVLCESFGGKNVNIAL